VNYYEAPNRPNLSLREQQHSIFIAGSITGATNWQKGVAEKLLPYYHVFNPRRADFDVSNPLVEREQITWEYDHIKRCQTILFYFAPETLAPITLFEYGKVLVSKSHAIYVCVHPDYQRKNDVIIQTELEFSHIAKEIVFNLDEMVDEIIKDKKWLDGINNETAFSTELIPTLE